MPAPAPDSRPLYVVGDIHGQYNALMRLLHTADLITPDGTWAGGTTRLWFMGDFFDRGTGSLPALALVMRLQSEATAAGGQVGALLGNHEVMFLAAHHFQADPRHSAAMRMLWLINGGLMDDLETVTTDQIAWLRALPTMARVDNWLFVHADSVFYTHYGDTVDEVNTRVSAVLRSDDPQPWEHLLDQFAQRMMFLPGRTDGAGRAQHILDTYGGTQIVHGHTPIHYITGQEDAGRVTAAFEYARRGDAWLCVNVDGGLYAGGSGFLHRLK